jgi:hypothetical protein
LRQFPLKLTFYICHPSTWSPPSVDDATVNARAHRRHLPSTLLDFLYIFNIFNI